jgi:hypothetical protein
VAPRAPATTADFFNAKSSRFEDGIRKVITGPSKQAVEASQFNDEESATRIAFLQSSAVLCKGPSLAPDRSKPRDERSLSNQPEHICRNRLEKAQRRSPRRFDRRRANSAAQAKASRKSGSDLE